MTNGIYIIHVINIYLILVEANIWTNTQNYCFIMLNK